jgi:hypothetical protein
MIGNNEDVESGNIHLKWLDNIYEKLHNIENMEVLSREGCESLMEFLEIPYNVREITISQVQYKNIRFMITELKILIDNLSPVLKGKVDDYHKQLEPIEKNIDDKKLFFKQIKMNNEVVALELTDIFYKSLAVLTSLKSSIIKEIAPLLYLEEGHGNKKPWEV